MRGPTQRQIANDLRGTMKETNLSPGQETIMVKTVQVRMKHIQVGSIP